MICCRYCHNEALKSFNDEPVCINCFDALTNREAFSNLPGVSEAREEYEPPFIKPKDLKLSMSNGKEHYSPYVKWQNSNKYDPNQDRDEYLGL